MSVIQEFKDFAVKGNVIDMAVGIIIGAAFGTVVKSLVNDVIMPPIGKLLGGVNFSDLFVSMSGSFDSLAAAQEAGAATINYGLFINNLISFLVVAWAVFLLVKAVNKMKKEEPVVEEEPSTKECGACKTEIHIEASKCAHCTSDC